MTCREPTPLAFDPSLTFYREGGAGQVRPLGRPLEHFAFEPCQPLAYGARLAMIFGVEPKAGGELLGGVHVSSVAR